MKETMTPRERVLTAIAHREPDRVPLAYLSTLEVQTAMEQYLGLAVAPPDPRFPVVYGHGPELMERLNVDFRHVYPRYIGPPLETFDDGSYMDEWGYRRKAGAWGVATFYTTPGPPLADVSTVEEVDAYRWPDPDWWDYSVIPLQCERYDRYAIVAGDSRYVNFINLASVLCGQEKVMLGIGLRDPALMAIFDHISDFYYEYDRRILEAGRGRIDIMHYGDDYGTQRGLFISPKTYLEMFKPRWRRHIEQARSAGTKIMLHSCGSTRALIPDLIETGFEILTTVQPEAVGMNLTELKAQFGERLTFNGTVSVQQDLPGRTPEQVREVVRQRIQVMAPGGGFVLSPTHAIQPDVSPENVMALYEAALEFGWYAGRGV